MHESCTTADQFEWRLYRRAFRQPLRTHHGSWAVREGIIVRLQNAAGEIGWGEIAPIPWFGSETIDRAIDYCKSLNGQITESQLAEIPDSLPACQFGLAAALELLRSNRVDGAASLLPSSRLLSPDEVRSVMAGLRIEDLIRWRCGIEAEGRAGTTTLQESQPGLFPFPRKTFKCKIGVHELDREMSQLDRLLKVLPEGAKLRLDANGGLSEAEAYRWLDWCDSHAQNSHAQIEFLEQPLSSDRFAVMQQLSQQFQTPIALDESVATIAQLQDCYARGWRGIFVIKPAIAGLPDRLRQFCREAQPDVVWSSALETGIGQRYIKGCLIPATALIDRAIGFGVDDWFADDWGARSAASLWQTLAGVLA